MILETVSVGPMQANCYILASGENRQAIIIDPGAEARKIKKVLDKFKLTPAFIINTHGHFDHIGCDDKFDVPIYVHRQDLPLLKDSKANLSSLFSLSYNVDSKVIALKDKDKVRLDTIELEVLHIPGHTPGGIALVISKPQEKKVFTGDTLFFGGIGRTDFALGDELLLIKSIKEKLLTLPDDMVIYPGHGPTSTIAEEKINNPFLN